MIPIRRFSAFISRISLTVILVLTLLFVIFSLTKHLFKTDTQRFVPVGSHLLKSHRHHGEHHQAHRRVSTKKKTKINFIEIFFFLHRNLLLRVLRQSNVCLY